MKNEKINWICQGSSCQTKGTGKKKGRENHYWPYSIARTLAGGERSQDVSFYCLRMGGVKGETESWCWCQTLCGQGLQATAGLDSILCCLTNASRFLPAETEPNHMRWSQIKLLGDFCGLHRQSEGWEWNSPMESPRSQTMGVWRPHGPSSLDVVPLARAWAPGALGEWEGWGTQREEGQTLSRAKPTHLVSPFPRLFALADRLSWPPIHRTTYKCIEESPLLSKAASSHSVKAYSLSTPSPFQLHLIKCLLHASHNAKKKSAKTPAHSSHPPAPPLLQRPIKSHYPSAGSLRHNGHWQPVKLS